MLATVRRTFVLITVLLSISTLRSEDITASVAFPAADREWEIASPAGAGWDLVALKSVFAYAAENRTSSLVIAQNGKIVAERHRDLGAKAKTATGKPNRYFFLLHGKDAAGRQVEDVASIQKSVVAVLVGIAIEKQWIDLESPVSEYLGTGWSKASGEQESKILVRHLMTMTSGLSSALAFRAPPGTVWKYNTAAYSRTLSCIEAASKMTANELTKALLTGPLGMKHSRWVQRPNPHGEASENSRGFATTARDLARFGLLLLGKGTYNNNVIVRDKNYLNLMTSSSQELNPSYGYLWWLNGKPAAIRGGRRVRGPLNPAAPSDLVAGLGALGRKLYVVPSLNLVVTRLGNEPAPRFDAELWKRLMKAAPAGN